MIVSNKVFTLTVGAATSAGIIAVEAPHHLLGSADGIVTWVLGAGFSTLLAANIGSVLAMLIAEPVQPPRKMWALFVAVSLLAAACVAFVPFIPGFGWVAKAPPQATGLIFGFLGRWGIPALIKHLPGKIGALLGSKDVGGEK